MNGNGGARLGYAMRTSGYIFFFSKRHLEPQVILPPWFTRSGFSCSFRVPEDDQVDLKKAPVGESERLFFLQVDVATPKLAGWGDNAHSIRHQLEPGPSKRNQGTS